MAAAATAKVFMGNGGYTIYVEIIIDKERARWKKDCRVSLFCNEWEASKLLTRFCHIAELETRSIYVHNRQQLVREQSWFDLHNKTRVQLTHPNLL